MTQKRFTPKLTKRASQHAPHAVHQPANVSRTRKLKKKREGWNRQSKVLIIIINSIQRLTPSPPIALGADFSFLLKIDLHLPESIFEDDINQTSSVDVTIKTNFGPSFDSKHLLLLLSIKTNFLRFLS